VLAFRGTADLRDWIADCEFLTRPTYLGGSVHDGFWADATDLYVQLHNLIEAALQTDQNCSSGRQSALTSLQTPSNNGAELTSAATRKPLFITGHSLGGALAILCAQLLERNGITAQAVYTFGQPRVGDCKYAAAYNALLGAKTFRLVYENDLVPHVPLPGLLCRYRQNDTEVFLREHYSGIPHFQFKRSGAQKLLFDAVMLFHAWRLIAACKGDALAVPLELIDDVKNNHAIENYILHLNSLL
jgi:hypothetical protein